MDATSEALPEVYMSPEELAEEINFQIALLATINDEVPDKDEAIAEIKKEINSLKRRLQGIRGKSGRSSSQLGVFTSNPQPSSLHMATSSNDDDPFTDTTSTAVSNIPRAFSSTSSTPQSDNSMLQPSHLRKRAYSGNGATNNSIKSRRTTPGSNTGSSSGLGWSTSRDGFFDLTGDSDSELENDLSRFHEQQFQAEALAKREQDDREYAMQLQNQYANGTTSSSNLSPSSSAGVSSRPSPNAYNRLMGPPSELIYAPEHNSGPRHINTEHPIRTLASRNVKSEPSSRYGQLPVETPTSRMPGAFPEGPPSANDSGVELITSDEFRNAHRPHPLSLPYQSGQYQTALENTYRIPPYSRNNGNSFGVHPFGSIPPASGYATSPRAIKREHNKIMRQGGQPSSSYGQYGTPGYGMYDPYSQSGSLHNRFPNIPDTSLNDGRFNGLSHNMPANRGALYRQDGLSTIIDRSAGIDYSKGIDMNGNPLDPRAAAIYDYVNDPRKTEQEIKDLLENIRPDMDIPKQDREGTPDQLVCALYEHQKLALAWMKSMEEGTNKGGILADDMGLGKTISTLALMVSRPSQDRRRKTTLIVGPVALVRQWQDEIKRKIKFEHRFSVFLYHGKKATWDNLREYDVVLTTYGTLAAEFKRLEKAELERKMNPVTDQEWIDSGKKRFPFLGPASKWYRVILDEAQYIKNKNTQSSQAACHLHALSRFCLTGTPMMNGVVELYSLIKFLRIKPYNEQKRFTEDFGALNKNDGTRSDTKRAMKRLQALLKAILLRRTKTSKVDGEPILKSLPAKEVVVDHVIFSDDEQTYYRSLENKSQIMFNKYLKAGTVGKNYSNILVLLLRLRQCCCHPHLIMDFEEAPSATDMSLEDMDSLAKTLSPDVVGRIKSADGAGFECPVCYDINLNPRFVLPCGHDTCVECLTKITDQADREGGEAKCPTCRGKINLKQIIDYMAFKRVHLPAAEEATPVEELNDNSDTGSETDSEMDSEDDDSDSDLPNTLEGFIVSDEAVVDDDDDETQSEDDGEPSNSKQKVKTAASKRSKKSKGKKSKTKKRDVKGKGKAKEEIPHTSLAKLKKESVRSAEKRKRYMRYLKKNWQPSAKVSKCCELVKEVVDTTDEKIIIFSQWTSLLDLLEIPIKHTLKIGYQRYDGSMSADARDSAAYRFNNSPECRIMLISLKAGNAGLNLVAASQVIILDPFWNPFIENQAVDRAHRIGQRKIVKVHRILIEETVEDRIIALQDKKRQLVEAALSEKASKNLGRLGQRELAYLFAVGELNAPS